MKKLVICVFVLLLNAIGLNAQTVSCPATRDGQKLTNVVFYKWLSLSPTRSMALDRRALMPDQSQVAGDDWLQSWNVIDAVEGNGLQMICQYQGVKAGLFIEVKDKVSVCTLSKRAGVVKASCK